MGGNTHTGWLDSRSGQHHKNTNTQKKGVNKKTHPCVASTHGLQTSWGRCGMTSPWNLRGSSQMAQIAEMCWASRQVSCLAESQELITFRFTFEPSVYPHKNNNNKKNIIHRASCFSTQSVQGSGRKRSAARPVTMGPLATSTRGQHRKTQVMQRKGEVLRRRKNTQLFSCGGVLTLL